MNRISCLIVETDQEAIRQIDILSRRIGSIEVRWKTHSVQTGFDIIRKHLPEMAIVGLGQTPDLTIESISAMAKDFPYLYLASPLRTDRLRPHPADHPGRGPRLPLQTGQGDRPSGDGG